jgi:hypothetical protein
MLKDFYQGAGLTPLIFDCLDLMGSAIAEVERDSYREIHEKSKRGQHG